MEHLNFEILFLDTENSDKITCYFIQQKLRQIEDNMYGNSKTCVKKVFKIYVAFCVKYEQTI